MSRPHASRPHASRCLAVGVTVTALAVLAGCGIPLDDSPRALSGSLNADADGQTLATGDATDDTAYLFYVHSDGLVAVSTRVADRDPDTVLTALLTTKPSGPDADQLISQLPNGTRLLDLQRNGNRVLIDLSDEFASVNGPALQLAVGQIVLTLTDLQGISTVAFRVDGKDATVSSPRGDANEVGTCDVVSLLDGPDEVTPSVNSTSTSTAPATSPDGNVNSTTTSQPADTAALKRIELRAQCRGG